MINYTTELIANNPTTFFLIVALVAFAGMVACVVPSDGDDE